MMKNTNSSKTKAGLIAAICSEHPSKVESGNIEHEIIQGVAFDQRIQAMVFVYHKWRKMF